MGVLDDLFGRPEDRQIPGGCDRCDAYQTLDEVEPGVHLLIVHHDDFCPVYRSMNAGSN